MSLTIKEVQLLFADAHMRNYVSTVSAKKINGEILFRCKSQKGLRELVGMTIEESRKLQQILKKYRNDGVPSHILAGGKVELCSIVFDIYCKIDSSICLMHLFYQRVAWILN